LGDLVNVEALTGGEFEFCEELEVRDRVPLLYITHR
jgi:hypothetical protein